MISIRWALRAPALMALIALTAHSPLAHAGSIGIAIDQLGIPANDLIFSHPGGQPFVCKSTDGKTKTFTPGQRLDSSDAKHLAGCVIQKHPSDPKKNQYYDISVLDPSPNDTWAGKPLPISNGAEFNYPPEGAHLDFVSQLGGFREMHRVRAVFGAEPAANGKPAKPGMPFFLTSSVRAHTALTTAALLRKLGYPIASPRHYKKLTIAFADAAAKARFIDQLEKQNLANSDRWVISSPIDLNEIILQDVLLEPAQVDVWNFHWGAMDRNLINNRRALRGLLLPLVLSDISQSVNLYSWNATQVFSNAAVLQAPQAEEFAEATYMDLRWAMRKIAALTRADFAAIVAEGRYPEDVAALLVEKFIGRRNDLAQVFLPAQAALPYNARINIGAVKNGKLEQQWYPGYAIRFDNGDPRSPLTDIQHYFKFPIYDGVAAWLTSKGQEFIQKTLLPSVSADTLQQRYTEMMSDCQKNGGCTRPLGVWALPVVGVNATTSRDITTGTYYGSDAKVQMVTRLGVSANAGVFMGLDKPLLLSQGSMTRPPVIAPVNGMTQIAYSRDYVHVRPVLSIKEAADSKQSDRNVIGLMRKYAQELERESKADVNDPANKPSTTFLEDLQEGEMFIVTDSVSLGAQVNAIIPIGTLLNFSILGVSPSLTVGVSGQKAILSRTTILRDADGIQVYFQGIDQKQITFSLDADFWINFFKYSATNKIGAADVHAYILPKDVDLRPELPDEADRRRVVARALAAVFKSNNDELLQANFKNYELDHETSAKIFNGKFLRWRWYGLDESHRLKIRPPEDTQVPPRYKPADFERTLFGHRIVRTQGSNDAAWLNDVIKKYVPELSVFPDGGGPNPSTSFLGRGKWAIWQAEAEITPGKVTDPVTSVEHHWGGWILEKGEFLGILDSIERQVSPLNFEKPIINRDVFKDMKQLQFFDIVTKLVLYKAGLDGILKQIRPQSGGSLAVYRTLRALVGEKEMIEHCRSLETRPFGEQPSRAEIDRLTQVLSDELNNQERVCIKDWMREVLAYAKDYPKDPGQTRTVWAAKLIRALESNLPFPALAEWIGKKNFFYTVRISGFRTKDSDGDTEFISDSIGNYKDVEGAGPFAELADKTGISTNELMGRYLSEGF